MEWKTTKRVEFKGSHETTVNVKCDGHRVEFSGNVSRFCRPDNLFGFDLWECLGRVNSILNAYGLPPFTPGKRIELTRRDGDADYRYSG
ncbi:DNA replication protein, partial [Pseudomonas sp. GW460-E13]